MTYDKPITIQVQDPDTEAWSDRLHLHARINKDTGDRAISAGADQYRVRLTFDLRWCRELEDIAYSVQPYRIRYRGHTFTVQDYDDYMEQHRTVRLIGEHYG